MTEPTPATAAPTAPSEQPLLSRTGISSPFGALTEDVKTKVDPETAEMLRQVCAGGGTNVSEQLREYVYWLARGKKFSQFVHEESQRRRLNWLPEGPNQGLLGARQ